MATAPYQKGNQWWIDKDPDDQRFYSADVTNDLTDMNTTIQSVNTIVSGVTVLQAATFQGSVITVKLGGLDVSAGGQNFCTFRVTCVNGEQFDRTIWFARDDH